VLIGMEKLFKNSLSRSQHTWNICRTTNEISQNYTWKEERGI